MFWGLLLLITGFRPVRADVKFSADAYLSHSEVEIQPSLLNPENALLELPHSKTDLDLRPEVKLREARWQMVVRPRFVDSLRQISKNGVNDQVTKSNTDLTDAFVENNWSGKFSTTVGLQVYQWGPAELLNSSNPFSHFNPQQRNLLYKEKGRGLVRANYSFNKENSLVAAIEPISNQDPEWIAEDHFTAKGVLKYEKSWSGTLNAIGLTTGQAEKNNFFVGEYFSYYVTEGVSVYADLKQQKEKVNFRPVWNGTSYDLQPDQPAEARWPTLGVFGIRWEQVFDWRIEYIYNQAGYDRDEMKAALASGSNFFSPLYAQNLGRLVRPGLELMGRQYLYSSFRVTDPGTLQNFSFYLRFLYSFQDDSSQVQVELEKALFDAWTFYAGQSLGHFQSTSVTGVSEFRLVQQDEGFVGLRWSY